MTAALVAALPLSSSATAKPSATRVVKVVAWETGSRITERPPAGIAGDVITGSDRLRNAVAQFGRPAGAVVGTDRYRAVIQSPARASIEVTTTLPGGTIRCRGALRSDRPSAVIALVGGTGDYAGATGTCTAAQGSPSVCRRPDERKRTCELNTYRIRT